MSIEFVTFGDEQRVRHNLALGAAHRQLAALHAGLEGAKRRRRRRQRAHLAEEVIADALAEAPARPALEQPSLDGVRRAVVDLG